MASVKNTLRDGVDIVLKRITTEVIIIISKSIRNTAFRSPAKFKSAVA